MIIQYDPVSGKIMQIISGNDTHWTEEVIEDWNINNPDSLNTMAREFAAVDGLNCLMRTTDLDSLEFIPVQNLDIVVDKEQVSALGSETVTFSSVPEGTSIESDYFESSPIIMDSTETLEIDFEGPGTYRFTFKARGFDWFIKDILVN